jgi:hypothetical protein
LAKSIHETGRDTDMPSKITKVIPNKITKVSPDGSRSTRMVPPKRISKDEFNDKPKKRRR